MKIIKLQNLFFYYIKNVFNIVNVKCKNKLISFSATGWPGKLGPSSASWILASPLLRWTFGSAVAVSG